MATTRPSRVPTKPRPSAPCRVCPTSWECQFVRAPGVNRTRLPTSRDGPAGVVKPVTNTSPVNVAAGPLLVLPMGECCMVSFVLLAQWSCSSEGEQDLGGAALVHRLVALGGLLEGEDEVEDLAGVDLPVPDELDQVRQEAAHGSR